MREIELDVVRGIAILLAMGWHFNGIEVGIAPVDWLLAPGRLFGWAGVDLFFVLSGFLVGRLIFREHSLTGAFEARRFLIRRALKIWPILYVFLACQLILGFKPWDTYLPQSLIHLQNYFDTSILHLWSLAVEEHFYLIFAIGFACLAAAPNGPRLIVRCCFLLLLIAPALRILAVIAAVDPVAIQWQTQYRMDSLASGVILAWLSVYRKEAFDRLTRPKLALICITIAGCGFLAATTFQGPLSSTLGYTIAYIAAGSFLLACYRSSLVLKGRAVFAPLAFIGTYSYAMYIWHPGMVRLADYAKPYLSGLPFENGALLLVRYGGAILVAIIVTKAIERPFLMIRDRVFPRTDGGTGVAPGSNTIRTADATSFTP